MWQSSPRTSSAVDDNDDGGTIEEDVTIEDDVTVKYLQKQYLSTYLQEYLPEMDLKYKRFLEKGLQRRLLGHFPTGRARQLQICGGCLIETRSVLIGIWMV